MMSILNKVESQIKENSYGDIHYKKWTVDFRNNFFKDVYWSYFPATEKYFFEANPSFLYEYRNLSDKGRYPLIMVRDGFSGILDFFINYPIPPSDFKTILLLPKKFEKLIPRQWKDFVAVYSFFATKSSQEKNELIIYGVGGEDLFWYDDLSERVAKLKEISNKYSRTTFLIHERESLISLSTNQNKKYHKLLMKTLRKEFEIEIKVTNDIYAFLKTYRNNNFDFVNLDHVNGFIYDNYIDHHLSSLGGVNLDFPRQEDTNGLQYHLSPFHGLNIEEVNVSDSIFPKFYLPYRLSGSNGSTLYRVYQNSLFVKLNKENLK